MGTAARFLVGGGILAHGIPGAEGWIHALAEVSGSVAVAGGLLEALVPLAVNAAVGIAAGASALAVLSLFARKGADR